MIHCKNHLYRTVLTCCCFIFLFASNAQQNIYEDIDSLKKIVKNSDDDTLKIRALNFLAHYYDNLDSTWSIDSSLYYLRSSQTLMEESGNETYSSYAFAKESELFSRMNDHENSLKAHLKYLEIAQEYQKVNWEADALAELMKLFDKMKDTARAEGYAQKLVLILDKMTSTSKKIYSFSFLGTHYKNISDEDKALKYHNLSLELSIKSGDKRAEAFAYNNIGLVYKNQEKYEEALINYKRSLILKEEIGYTKGIAGTNINIAKVYFLSGKYSEGIPYATKGIQLAEKVKAKVFLSNGYRVLYQLEKGLFHFNQSLDALEKHLELDKEISDQKKIEHTRELERKYFFEKREKEVQILQLTKENQDLEISKHKKDIAAQKNIILLFTIGSVLFVVLIVFLVVNRNQKAKMNFELKKKNMKIQAQREETEFQKTLVETKNKEILDSINYAKKIQSTILPTKDKIDSILTDYFILFKPKAIVAGDFYWFEKVDNIIFYAAADCTGHGVPGAMVSVVCSNILTKVLMEEGERIPSKILDRTRELVVEYFERGSEEIKDGMDIALVALHLDDSNKVKFLEYSGAHNPLVIIPKGSEIEEVSEIKGMKQPIGKFSGSEPFQNHKVDLNEGDSIYIFTDGYQDQFGGEHKGGKKLKAKNFIKLLYSYHKYDMEDQEDRLNLAFHKWAGDLEQVDDVCVIGVRV